MIDPERIQRLAAKMGDRKDALEFVRQMRCGGKKYGDGGGEKKPGVKDWLHDRLVDAYYNMTFKPAIRKYGLDGVRQRLYDHVDPFGYDNARDRIDRALSTPPLSGFDIEDKTRDVINSDARYRDDIWRRYLGVPEELGHLNGWDNVNRVVESEYGPTIGGSGDKYYTIGASASDKKFGLYSGGKDDELVNTALFGEREVPYSTDESRPLSYGEVVGSNVLGRYFGSHSLSRGVDPQRGDYVSFYDLWDIAPSEGEIRSGSADESHGIGTPIPFYDRLYLDDYFGVDSRPGPGEYYGGYIMPSVSNADYWYGGGVVLGGREYPDGGKFFRTNLENESPMMYQPMKPWMPDVSVPMRFIPEPNLGDYVPPSSTGLAENYPVTVSVPSPRADLGFVEPEVVEDVVDLFSDEAKARRRLKQRYAESRFNNKAVSKAGAQGAWQIMPITLKDYLGRGRGKAGDLDDPEYNGKIRDWVMGIIPRDLQEFWSEDDSDINKLAKLYAAYNWGAGSLRNFLRKRQKAGKSIDDPYEWVEDLNPETRRYVKYLAFDEDIPDSSYTNTAFEDAARSRGYMAEGGPKKSLFDPKKVAERVPGDGAYDGGTSGVLDAIRNYRKNDDRYVQDRLEAAMNDAAEGHLHTDELSSMLMHEDAKRIYLGLPQLYGSLEPSPYRPTIGKMDNPYQVNALLSDREFEDAILPMWATWKSGQDWPAYDTGWRVKDLGMTAQLTDFPYLHNAGMSEGYDDKGQYISLQDVWDYNTSIVGKGKDNIAKWVGGKPFDIYQRYYLDDWLDIPEEARGNPYIAPSYIEADYTGYKNGGRIHIRPENRGKFTALKKRTGHSASWFKAHGTPAQKKMAVFALNAKKWKHENGGHMNRYDGETEPTGQIERLPWWQRMVQGATMAEAPAVMTAAGMEIGPDGTITYGNDSEGVRRLRENLVGIGAAGLGSFLGGSGLLYDIGKSAAVGLDTMGRMAMPSTFLKGVSYYAPKAAGALGVAAPWLDAGALSLWSAEAGKSAIDAAKEGRTGDAIGLGALSAMPIVMPLGMKAYQSGKNFINGFKLSPYDIDLGWLGADLDRSELLQRGEYAKNLLNRFYAISGRTMNLRGWDPYRPQRWYNFPGSMQSMRSNVYGQFADVARSQGVPLEEYLGDPGVAQIIYDQVRPATSRLRHSLRGLRGLSNSERLSRQSDNFRTMQNLMDRVRRSMNPQLPNSSSVMQPLGSIQPDITWFDTPREINGIRVLGHIDNFDELASQEPERFPAFSSWREQEMQPIVEVPSLQRYVNAASDNDRFIPREVTQAEREEIARMFGEGQAQARNRGSDADIEIPFWTAEDLRRSRGRDLSDDQLMRMATATGRDRDEALAAEARSLLEGRGIDVPESLAVNGAAERRSGAGMVRGEYERLLAEYIDPYERALDNVGESEHYARTRANRELENARQRFAARYYPLENGSYVPYTSDPDYPYEDLSVDTLNDMWNGTLFSDANNGLRLGDSGRLDMDAIRERLKRAIRTVARRPYQEYFGDLSGLTEEQLLNGIERLRDRNLNYDYFNMNSGMLSSDEGAVPTQYNLRGRLASELFRRYNSEGRTIAMAPDNVFNAINEERFNSNLTTAEYDALANERNLRAQARTSSWFRTPEGYSAHPLTSEEMEAQRVENAGRHQRAIERARSSGEMNSYINELRRNAKIETGGATAGTNAYRADFRGSFSERGKELGEALNEYFAGKVASGESYVGQVPDFSKIESVEDAGKVAKFLRENNLITPDTDLPWDITSLFWVSGDASGVGNTALHMLGSVPSGFSLRIGSLSGDSVPLALKGALTNYGTGPGQFTVVPAGREHSLNGMQVSALRGINPDGTAIFTQPGMIRKFGSFDPKTQLFTPEEAAEILGHVNRSEYGLIKPEFIDRYQAAADAVDRASAERINSVIRQINEKNAELGLPQLDMARSTRTHKVGFDDEYKSRGDLWRPGFRNMKHKYGGMMNRMNAVYGNDGDKIRQAIANARAKKK